MVEHKILFDDDTDAPSESDMHISPAEILEKEFAQRFRGYDVHQVDAFLEDVAKELARVSNVAEGAFCTNKSPFFPC